VVLGFVASGVFANVSIEDAGQQCVGDGDINVEYDSSIVQSRLSSFGLQQNTVTDLSLDRSMCRALALPCNERAQRQQAITTLEQQLSVGDSPIPGMRCGRWHESLWGGRVSRCER